MKKKRNIIGVAAIVLAIALPLYLSGSNTFLLYVINLGALYSIVAIGLNLLVGLTGQISLGHAAFLSIGAYMSCYLTETMHLPFLLAMLLSGLVSLVFGILLGIPALRLSGPYLAIATLGFATAVTQILAKWESFSGGFSGLWVSDAEIFGFPIDNELKYFYLIVAVLLLLILFSLNLKKSKAGRAFMAIRDSETAAVALGINVPVYKLLAFAVSTFFTGIAGSIYAHMVGYLSPTNFTLVLSINFLMMIVIGGMTSISGGVIGACFVTWLPFAVDSFSRYLPEAITNTAKTLPQVLIGVCVILIILYLPNGISAIRVKRRKGGDPA